MTRRKAEGQQADDKEEIRLYGEYRTERLVLEAWGRMEVGYEFKAMGQ